MTGRTLTREDLNEAIRREVDVSAHEAAVLVKQVLDEITACLARGEVVKLTGFGLFTIRRKGPRVGRNPKTLEAVPISARRVVSFKASAVLKQRINSRPALLLSQADSNAAGDAIRS
jgi:integration host factor subunit alpha